MFDSNSSATGDGGAIQKGTNGTMNISASFFFRNTAGGTGGAIDTNGPGTIFATAFLDNEGKYDDAEKMAETAVTMARYLYKKDHKNLRDALRTHAVVLHSKGRYESALLLAHDALEMSRRLNATHIGRAPDLELVGLLLKDKGAFAEAEPYLLDSLNKVTRRSGGEDRG